MYKAHFRCPVKFKSDQNALVFSNADMEIPFVTYNPDLATVAAYTVVQSRFGTACGRESAGGSLYGSAIIRS